MKEKTCKYREQQLKGDWLGSAKFKVSISQTFTRDWETLGERQ